MLAFFSRNYVTQLKFRSDREKFVTTYIKMFSKSMGYFDLSWNYYKSWGIQLEKNKNYIIPFVYSWNQKVKLSKVTFNDSKIDEILINWSEVNSWDILFRSYEVNVWFDSGWNLIKTWNLQIILEGKWQTWDFLINLDIGKVY